MFNSATSSLILVDYQTRLLPSIHDANTVINNAIFLAKLTKLLDIPILGTEQNPQGLGANDVRIRDCCDHTLLKHSFDAVTDGLVDLMLDTNPKTSQVIVAGCETHVCLMQTVLGLREQGYTVGVIPEACGSRVVSDKLLALDRMRAEGIVMLSIEMIIFEWLKNSNHPQFKNILQLIKTGP